MQVEHAYTVYQESRENPLILSHACQRPLQWLNTLYQQAHIYNKQSSISTYSLELNLRVHTKKGL